MSDPVEDICASALTRLGVDFVRDGDGDTKALDFLLPNEGIYIECKQFHNGVIQ